jgi:hypothetical protein
MDRETQLSLGLNHGLPNWYRREYGVNIQSPLAPPALPGPSTNRLNGPWRRLEAAQADPGYAGTVSPSPGPSMRTTVPSTRKPICSHITDFLANNSSATMRGGYGPIAPPPGQPGHSFSHANPFASLKIEEGEEEDDDQVTYRGRGGPQGPTQNPHQQ